MLLAVRFSTSCGFLRLDFQLLAFRMFLRVNRKNDTFLLLAAACVFLQRKNFLRHFLRVHYFGLYCTQQRYYIRKATEAISTTLSVISPGQENEIWSALHQASILLENQTPVESSKQKYFDQKSVIIDALVKAHNEAESWQTKRQILSLFANDFSRAELQQMIPRLSKWWIDQAWQHVIHTGQGQPVPDQPIFRTRIDAAKVDHLLDFIARPDLLQDVAFGTKNLKLDSVHNIIIPAVIRTLIPSCVIKQYAAYCKQQSFEAASDPSLFRILNVCSA